MKKTNSQNAITLIALIITIIVLLILAVVTIGAIKNDGLIQYAQNARTDYTDAANKEQEALNTLFDKIEGNVPGNNGEEKEEGEGITTQEAVAAGLAVGDYVSYPVEYTNVGTRVDLSTGQIKNYPLDTYIGWRVLSIEGKGEDTCLRLVPAGVPLNYYHGSSSSTTVENLTTGFFNTPINSTLTQYNFYSCGFKDASGNPITNIADLKTLFTNKYTQIEGTTPKVQAMTLEDVNSVWGSYAGYAEVTSNNLLAIPCKDSISGAWVPFWLATANGEYIVWYVREYVYGDAIDDYMNRCAPGSFSKVGYQNVKK